MLFEAGFRKGELPCKMRLNRPTWPRCRWRRRSAAVSAAAQRRAVLHRRVPAAARCRRPRHPSRAGAQMAVPTVVLIASPQGARDAGLDRRDRDEGEQRRRCPRRTPTAATCWTCRSANGWPGGGELSRRRRRVRSRATLGHIGTVTLVGRAASGGLVGSVG